MKLEFIISGKMMHLSASESWSELLEIHVMVEAWVDKDESGGSISEKKRGGVKMEEMMTNEK